MNEESAFVFLFTILLFFTIGFAAGFSNRKTTVITVKRYKRHDLPRAVREMQKEIDKKEKQA